MFNRLRQRGSYEFSLACRRVLVKARLEAHTLGHSYVGTEHVLLAIINEPDQEAVRLVAALGLVPDRVRRSVLALVPRITSGTGRRGDMNDLPYTSRAKKVLELAMAAERELHDGYVGVQHLLLGLIAEEKGIAAQALRKHGVTHAAARAAIADPSAGQQHKIFAVQIDDNSESSIYEQIVHQIQEAVATGKLVQGERLAPVRALADELDIAPGTVARAYSELERLAIVVTDGARGTRIASRPQRAVPNAERPEALLALLRPAAVAAFHLGASASELREALEAAMRDIFPERLPNAS